MAANLGVAQIEQDFRVVEYYRASNDVSTETKDTPLLRSVTRKRLVKADYEDLACAVVICKACRLAMAL
jgi:hypothetical protein